MTEKVKGIDKYKSVFKALGCDPVGEESDNQMGFSYNGINYIFRVDSNDDGFVEIILPYDLESDLDSEQRYLVCNHIAKTYKLVKCFYMEDAIFISTEAFVKNTNDFKKFLSYTLLSLHVAYDEVVDKFPGGV